MITRQCNSPASNAVRQGDPLTREALFQCRPYFPFIVHSQSAIVELITDDTK